jgi:hypothetical protein
LSKFFNLLNKAKRDNDYFRCIPLKWYFMQGNLHCLVPRKEDFLVQYTILSLRLCYTCHGEKDVRDQDITVGGEDLDFKLWRDWEDQWVSDEKEVLPEPRME